MKPSVNVSSAAPSNHLPCRWRAAIMGVLSLFAVQLSPALGELPDPEVIAALGSYPLLRTDRDGWIVLVTDGEQMWVDVERR